MGESSVLDELEKAATTPPGPRSPDAAAAPSADAGLVKELADIILISDRFARDAGGQLYAFASGVYRPNGEERIAQRVKSILVANDDTKRWSSHRAREVAEFIRIDAPHLWDQPPTDQLNLLNGLLDLSSRTLRPHVPEYLSPVQLPITYDPAATCSRWEAFIERVLPEDCRILPYELVAASMRAEVSDQKAILLVGPSHNGKSTLLGGIVSFLGRENVASLALQRLEIDKFSVVRLLGKLANICADLPSDHLTSTSTFKALTGGDRLTAERKFQGSFEFTPFARLLFSTNHYPQSKDYSEAFFRRWLPIPFDTVIEPQERILDLSARLADPHELSGVLNRALAVLPDMVSRGGFTQSESTRVAAREFREMTDPLGAWLDRFTVLSPEGMVSRKDLAISYNAAADSAGRPLMTSKAFCTAVRRLRPTIKDAQRKVGGEVKDVFLGLAMIAQPPSTTGQESAHSAHSGLFSQISLECEQKERKEEKNLNRGNGLNGLNGLTPLTGKGQPCFACKGTRRWRSIHGAEVCAGCHPPLSEDLVAEWIDGPQRHEITTYT
jgi:P4 family phage/plasmid primase-like protien